MPKVSVIIPNFNHSLYLAQRIESVLAQTYQDFEIILMDDCSTDDSRKIIESYSGHPKVAHVVYNEQNSGSTFKQWAKGISLSKGDYIWVAESDDWCEVTLLETLVDGISKNENIIISYCQSYCIVNEDEIRFQSEHPRLTEVVDGMRFIQDYLSVPVSIFNASMALWRKDIFQFVPEKLTSFKFCGDWYFWIQLSKYGSIHISGKVLNYFRKHENDVSTKAYLSGLNFIEELQIIDLLYRENLITRKIYSRAYKTKFAEYWLVRDKIDKANRNLIKENFRNSLSDKTSILRLFPNALWKDFKRKWKAFKKGN